MRAKHINRKYLRALSVLRWGAFVFLFAAGITGAQAVEETPELVPQIEIGGALLLAPLTDDAYRARLLAPERVHVEGNRYMTGGVAQWRDPETGEVLRTFPLAAWPVVETMIISPVITALSPSGEILATIGRNGTLFWQNAWTGKVLNSFEKANSPVSFSPQEPYFVSQQKNEKDEPGELVVRKVPTGEEVQRLALPSRVREVAWSTDGRRLVAIEKPDQNLQKPIRLSVWDIATGGQLFESQWIGRFHEARFEENGDLVVVSQRLGPKQGTLQRDIVEVRRWDSNGKAATLKALAYDGPFSNVRWKFLSDGRLLTSGTRRVYQGPGYHEEQWIYIWNKNTPPRRLNESESKFPEIATWKSAIEDATPRIAPGIAPVQKHGVRLAHATLMKRVQIEGNRVFVADDSRIWEAVTGKLRWSFEPRPPLASALEISPNAQYFASAGGGGFGSSGGAFLGVWRISDKKLLWDKSVSLNHSNGSEFAEAGTAWTTALHFFKDGKRLLVASALEQPRLAVYQVLTGKELWGLKRESSGIGGDVAYALLSPDNKRVAAIVTVWDYKASEISGRVEIFDTENGRQLITWPAPHEIDALGWSPDNTILAIASADGTVIREASYLGFNMKATFIQLCDAQTGTVRATLQGGRDIFTTIRFSPDGNHLAASSRDGRIRVWNIDSTEMICEMVGHAGKVRDVAWRGNNQVISVADDGATKFWDASNGKLLATTLILQPQNEWLSYTPDGFYEASPGAEKFIRWRIGTQLFPVQKFKARFNQPAKVRAALSN